MLFDSFEAYDVQETRRISRAEGKTLNLIEQVCKKIKKNYTVPEIADMLEEEESTIKHIYDTVLTFAPDYDAIKILEALSKSDS